jgi:hypothetical protein
MDEKSERPAAKEGDLAAALRRARIENAERAGAVAELREIELGRLALLESALQKVVRQAPPGVDLFDLTLAPGDRARVFLDMVAFIEMARDRRTYRFFQDTLYGRVLIAESPKIDTIVAACTNYVARRLVERERALATDVPRREDAENPRERSQATKARGESEEDAEGLLYAPLTGAGLASAATPERPPAEASAGSGLARGLVNALVFLLMTVGAITLASLASLAGYLAWTHRLGEVWTKTLSALTF